MITKPLIFVIALMIMALLPSGAMAAPPASGDPSHPQYCPSGRFYDYIQLRGGKSFGDLIQRYESSTGTSWGEAMALHHETGNCPDLTA